MKQHDHINEIFDSTKGMQKAEPSPFLFEQITARIEKGRVKPVSNGGAFLRWGLAVFVTVIITINIISLFKYRSISNDVSEINTTSSDSYFNNETVYNY